MRTRRWLIGPITGACLLILHLPFSRKCVRGSAHVRFASLTLSLSISHSLRLDSTYQVSLGLMGVVAEVTLQCVPAHDLLEHTFTLNRVEAASQLPRLLASHR